MEGFMIWCPHFFLASSETDEAVRRSSAKQVFSETSQNFQGNSCARVFLEKITDPQAGNLIQERLQDREQKSYMNWKSADEHASKDAFKGIKWVYNAVHVVKILGWFWQTYELRGQKPPIKFQNAEKAQQLVLIFSLISLKALSLYCASLLIACLLCASIFVYYVHSLLPKINELRNIAKLCNVAVRDISISELDNFISSSEIDIDNYNAFCCDWKRHDRRMVCYIRNDLSCDLKLFFPPEIENIFCELLLPKTKSIVAGIIYRPPCQSDFSVITNSHFSKLDTSNNKIYILDDFNISPYRNNSYIFQKNNLLQSQSIPSDIKEYCEFCTIFGVKCLVWFGLTKIGHISASFHCKMSFRWDCLINNNLESKEVRKSKSDAVHL